MSMTIHSLVDVRAKRASKPPAPRTAPELTEVEHSERQLAVLLQHASALHQANIAHDARTCLICFGAA